MPRLVRLPEPVGCVDDLRGTWARRSAELGWAFPSDWHSPSVDAVCEALTERRDVRAAGERLGRERATAGVSLAEALTDIDALAESVPAHAEALRRAVSLGWADRAAAPADAVSDALTGLASADYLRIRLGEVYRAADVEGSSAGDTHALVMVRLGRAGASGWAQHLPMILVGDSMRAVFAGGQSLARIGPLAAVALAPRSPVLARQARVLAELLAARIRVGRDPGLLPQVWIESLPPGWDAANALVAELGR
jgi:hypothetical protein